MTDKRKTPFGTVDVRIENDTPRFLARCMLKPEWKDEENRPLDYNAIYIFLGEIPNMPGHCVVVDSSTDKIFSGYHTDRFGEFNDADDDVPFDNSPDEVELWVAKQPCEYHKPCKPEDKRKCIPCEMREDLEERKA